MKTNQSRLDKVLTALECNKSMTLDEISTETALPRDVVQKVISRIRHEGVIKLGKVDICTYLLGSDDTYLSMTKEVESYLESKGFKVLQSEFCKRFNVPPAEAGRMIRETRLSRKREIKRDVVYTLMPKC